MYTGPGDFAGCAIVLAERSTINTVIENLMESNGFGIFIWEASTSNLARANVVRSSYRTGIVVWEPSGGNFIFENEATGNGTLDMEPPHKFDMWDETPLNNVWWANRGTAPFSQDGRIPAMGARQ